jgi:hypothetical protein
VSGGWRLGDGLGYWPRLAVLVGRGELSSRILPRLEFFSGANRRTVFLIDRGDAPEPISLSAQRNRRKKRTPRIVCPYGQPRERTPERGPQPFAVRAKGCLAGFPAGHPRPGARSRGKRSGGSERQNTDSVGWGECNEPQHDLRRPHWGSLHSPQPTPSIRECAAHRSGVRSVLTPRFPVGLASSARPGAGSGGRTPPERPFAGMRMAALPRDGVCARGLPVRDKASRAPFFRLFLWACKEIGSGASPRSIESGNVQSRPKRTLSLTERLSTEFVRSISTLQTILHPGPI